MADRDLTPDEARKLRDQVIFRPPAGGSGPPPQHIAGDPGCLLVVASFIVALLVFLAIGFGH